MPTSTDTSTRPHRPARLWSTSLAVLVAFGTASPLTAVAQALSVHNAIKIVHVFDVNKDGQVVSGMVLAKDGNLYGVTSQGGPTGNGAVYRVVPGGGYATIAGLPSSIGNNTDARLTLGPDGQLYGAPAYTSNSQNPYGGNLFKVTTTGVFTLIYASTPGTFFQSDRVTFDANSTLFGVTHQFGAGLNRAYRLDPNRKIHVLVTFNPQTNYGVYANPLTLGPDHNFYGTTVDQVDKHTRTGHTAFRLTPSGQYTMIATFVPNDAVRDVPANQLAIGPDFAFYGVTAKSTIYRLTMSGKLSLVADLAKAFASTPECQNLSQTGYSRQPGGPLAIGADGTIYGTSGPCIYSATTSGKVTLLAKTPGSNATAPQMPTIGSDGNLYGTAEDPYVSEYVYEVVLK